MDYLKAHRVNARRLGAEGQRPPRHRIGRYVAYLLFLTLVVASIYHMKLPLERLPEGLLVLGDRIVNEFFPPDLAYASERLVYPFVETFAMAIAGAIFGILLSVPLAWFASFNITPSPRILYPLARLVLIVTRSVHEIVWAMLLVAIFGFGPFPGTIVLILNFIGFGGKLLAENIEAADMKPVEAIRAVGGNRIRQMILGVYPQVRPVWIGIFIYGWDIVLRASFILGLVGAGGVGSALRGSIESLQYDKACIILIIIIIIVSIGEIVSVQVRKRIT